MASVEPENPDISVARLQDPPEQAQVNAEVEPVPFCQLFRFADKTDRILMGVGSVLAVLSGAALPVAMMFWGYIIQAIGNRENMIEETEKLMLQMVYVGLGAFFAGWGMVACWHAAGERQGIACRKAYMASLLRQQMGWYDCMNKLEITAKFNKQLVAFQEALNDKISVLVSSVSMVVAAFTISFIHGWLLTLVITCCIVFLLVSAILFAIGHLNYSVFKAEVTNKAGALVEQSVRSIKTVKMLNGEQFESERYADAIAPIDQNSCRLSKVFGLGTGLIYGGILFNYALGMWFGSHCIEGTSVCPPSLHGGDKYSIGDVFAIYASLQYVIFTLIQLSPALKKVIEGRVAAAYIFSTLDRQPSIMSPDDPQIIDEFKGVFHFDRVTFAYPSEPDHKILDGISFTVNQHSTAFAGDSGCGKSTIFQLMMRFYDPDEGRITLDGVDLRDLDLLWLRRQIGYVGQQPVLFAMSLRDNLLCGYPQATEDDISSALIEAKAKEFVDSLKDGLDTYVGTGGRKISGGQKQRLAIARVLLKMPKILLLDEATSALDRTNENLIKVSLKEISQSIKTITIAHRINTIRQCDQIFVISKGQVEQYGRFEQCQRFKGFNRVKSDLLTVEEQNLLNTMHQQRLQRMQYSSFQKSDRKESNLQLSGTVNPQLTGTLSRFHPNTAQIEQNTKQEQQGKNKDSLEERYSSQSVFARILQYCNHKAVYFFSLSMSFTHGLAYPFFCIFLARLIVSLYALRDDTNPNARSDINFDCLIMFIFGVGQIIVVSTMIITSYVVGDSITTQMRKAAFGKILRMPMSWLEEPRQSSGVLSSLLNVDCENVNTLIHNFTGLMTQIAAMVLGGVVISLVYEWRTGLVATALLPLILFAGYARMNFSKSARDLKDEDYGNESHFLSQAVIYIRTVQAINAESMFMRHQASLLDQPVNEAVKTGLKSGLTYGLSQLFFFACTGIIFYLGAVFGKNYNLELSHVLTAVYTFLFSGVLAGNKLQFMPEFKPVYHSALKLLQVYDSVDEDQLQSQNFSKMLNCPVSGQITFRNVSFSYLQRSQIFKNFALQVEAGESIGIAGHSGSGKSTIIQLLLRFYEPDSGQVLLDGIELKDYDIHYLRSCFGLVNQEPTLFNETIAFNVRYNDHSISDQSIKQALKDAQFSLQSWQASSKSIGQGTQDDILTRNVGVEGSHLSGGQKQRIAIARALVRKPQLLLFDEATSALDQENEQRVFKAMQKLSEGKTCLNIAHRVATLRNSNKILLFKNGQILESGTYAELLNKKGAFYEFEKGLLQD